MKTLISSLAITIAVFTCGCTPKLSQDSVSAISVGALAITPSVKIIDVGTTLQYSATGGTPPYNYEVFIGGGAITQAGFYLAPPVAGTAVVEVIDSNGVAALASLTISGSLIPLLISPTAPTLAMNDSLPFTASGGLPPYTYALISGVGSIVTATGSYTASAVGSADVEVTDSIGNTSDTTITVNPVLQISPTAQTISVTNNVAFSASGGVPPFLYSILAGGVGTINAATGIYTAPVTIVGTTTTAQVAVTDSFGNTSSAVLTINGNLAISPSVFTLAIGNTTTFIGAGGMGPYTFSAVSGTIGATSGIYTAPGAAGTDTVTVTDSAAHTNTCTVTINPALSIAAATLAINNTKTFLAAGGAPPYTYSTTIGTVVTGTGAFTAPGSTGSGTVHVTDSLGNTNTAAVTINPALSVSPAAKTVLTGAVVTLTPSGGVSPYSYSISSGGGSLSAATGASSNLTAPGTPGTTVVTVADALGNTSASTITINPVLTISPTSATLVAGNSANFAGTHGVPPYVFSSLHGTITPSTGAYTAGTGYSTDTITVTDSLLNTATASVSVSPALTISPTSITIVINSSTGFNPSGGVPPYSYAIASGGGTSAGALFTAPGAAGVSVFRVTDSLGNSATATITTGTFGTQETYTFAASADAMVNGLGQDSAGNIFAAGTAYDPLKSSDHWIVRRSTDDGLTWNTVDDFQYVSGQTSMAVSVTASGNTVVISGYGYNSGGTGHWIVRQSSSNGASGTWSTLDDFDYGGLGTFPTASLLTASGNLFVVGWANLGTSNSHALIRELPNAGSWSTVDDVWASAPLNSWATNWWNTSITQDASGKLYVGGYTFPYTSGSQYTYAGYRSSTNGTTWTQNPSNIQWSQSGLIGRPDPLAFPHPWGDGYYLDFAKIMVSPSNGDLFAYVNFFAASSTLLSYSTNLGGSWTSAGSPWPWDGSGRNNVLDVKMDSLGNIYAVGYYYDTNNVIHWLVQKMNGATWQWVNIDYYSLSATGNAGANAILVSQTGHLIVGGGATDSSNIYNWVIRRF